MLQPLRKSLDALREAVRVKDNPLTVVDRSHPYLLGMLWAIFAACLAIRFWYVFYNGPLNHLFSDPGRHWINGMRFFWPHIMGSIDPFMYQFWLRALQWLDHGTGVWRQLLFPVTTFKTAAHYTAAGSTAVRVFDFAPAALAR